METQIAGLSNASLKNRIDMFQTNIRVMRSEQVRIQHEINSLQETIRENNERIKLHKQLPYLVANVIEVW